MELSKKGVFEPIVGTRSHISGKGERLFSRRFLDFSLEKSILIIKLHFYIITYLLEEQILKKNLYMVIYQIFSQGSRKEYVHYC